MNRKIVIKIATLNVIRRLFVEIDLIWLKHLGGTPMELLALEKNHWNELRRVHPEFSLNLSGVNLSDFNLSDVDLKNIDLSGANLRGANLSEADLSGANLSGANLSHTNLTNADLEGIDLRRVNLTYSDMTGANLRYVDFSKTNLSTVNFRKANLRGADLSETNCKKSNFSGANLRKSNLFCADLSEAILVDTNLTNADLHRANLTSANLLRAQALGTNFQEANFTGACVEYWNINHSTNIDEIVCDYVYQRNDRQERRPGSGNFQPGDFTRLYQKVIETLDLIFQNGIDWKSFAVTLQELNTDRKLNIEYENTQLTVRAIEKGDDGSFVIRVNVPNSIDKRTIELEFKNKYKKQLKAQEEQYRQQLQAKDIDLEYHRQQNTSLTNIINTLASKETIINNNYMPNNQLTGDTINNSGNMGIGSNKGEIKDSKIAGTINEAANPSLADAAAEIRDLLTELEKSYPANTTTEKMVIATKAIERIEADPAWQQRTVNALKSGGIAALEKAIDNPIGAFLKGAFEGWNNEK
jgi:uncharacterized protein YjbI with pentapeptide repeats